jgi:uncharacterized protein YndB with AHSA1/START domain/predicted enzyme related to lactoylglutathione lyase
MDGKICYIEIPAIDIATSAAFYSAVFGWQTRSRGDGATAFDDTTGQVSGVWVRNRPPMTVPGFMIYIMVADANATIERALAHGARLTQPIGADSPEITARIADPAGNIIGIYQERTLSSTTTPTRPFTISRTFDAPRAKVWKAWTDRAELMKWFGPKGYTMTRADLDFRPGGSFLYCLKGPDGKEMWGKFVYREITAPDKIVLINSFSDAKGGLTRHPMCDTWPREMLSSTTFTELSGKTTITLTWSPLNASEEEAKTFDSSRDGMTQGWTGTMDQLADYLRGAR